jgi:pimeloyl-ACP methyl ester carboxylesterase
MTAPSGNLSRVRLSIDNLSYVETWNSAETKTVLVFIHGIFGSAKETWAATPQMLMTTSILADADFASFGYATKVIDFREPRFVVQSFVLWLRTHMAKYDNIFVIAHSMGGLIVRDACQQLITSSNTSDHQLFAKVRHCFLVAVPLSGSWAARLVNKIPIVRSLNRRIPYLAKDRITITQLSSYWEAVKAAKRLGIVGPRFSLFVGTDDALVTEPGAWAVTSVDEYEGPVAGTHSKIKTDIDINSTLSNRILQVINDRMRGDPQTQRRRLAAESSQNVLASQASAAPARTGGTVKPKRDVLFISCAAHKRSDGERTHPRTGGMEHDVADPDVGKLLIQTRAKILTLIQQGRIEGIEFKEGNRAARPQNQTLIMGPDLGGALNSSKYLPAYWRYMGRSYQATESQWKTFLERPESERPDVIIMSGLYGLVTVDEYIQNYDCHITDTDTSTGQIVRDYWKGALTDALISHLERLEGRGWEIGRVFDLLSERSYQDAIEWQRVYPRWSVMHRIFEEKAGRDALANMGIWVRDMIVNPRDLGAITAGNFYSNANFSEADRIAFEERLGESKLPVTRDSYAL